MPPSSLSSALEPLADAVYEAAVFPELWPRVVDQISAFAGAAGGSIHLSHGRLSVRHASERLEPVLQRWFEDGWQRHTFWHERALAYPRRAFYGLLDIASPEEVERDPMFNSFFRTRGLGWSIGSVFRGTAGDVVRLNIQYRGDYGATGSDELRRLDALRPHLARALGLLARSRHAKLEGGLQALEALGIAAAVVDDRHCVLGCTPAFEALAGQVCAGAGNRVVFADPRAQAAYDALGRHPAGVPAPGLVPIPSTDECPPAVANVLPLRGQAREAFGMGAALVVVSPARIKPVPDAGLLQVLYRLTPAEARLARAVAAGQSLADIARSAGLSRETTKAQIASIFAKTGTHRQSQLAALLAATPGLA